MSNDAGNVPNSLGILRSPRRSGAEHFHHQETTLEFTLVDFWRWSVSDLVSNATRGRLAEYLVAKALGISTAGVRDEWAAHDLSTPSGVKIEVKSAAYLQAWHQTKYSAISFSIRPSRAWDAETNALSEASARQADVYVFALLAHRDKPTLDPLDVAQWSFYALATRILDERFPRQATISLVSLDKLARPVSFENLMPAVEAAAAVQRAAAG
jgi:hypothetical protein